MTDPLESLSKRIEELESQLAFQDELIESLNGTVARQDGEILELKRQFSLLSERLKEIGDASPGAAPQDETPPHY
ncbi:MAG: SlyX family protein [Gammaproteobacteria bacterium]|nr:SlyX family protein [Gammaproteobacteria bacterium]